ncbi:hypothetical protein HII31_06966 [Pseudocercospora fuligena]|uniref:Uncharacterized protein n=1 Tax=Pseudocercospora fuligena TaxID=685502 RepID=A0A8H6RI76_9PEZI|nr:hypothetical protein HII31_06966 [Pseudocercospora fuligena]
MSNTMRSQFGDMPLRSKDMRIQKTTKHVSLPDRTKSKRNEKRSHPAVAGGNINHKKQLKQATIMVVDKTRLDLARFLPYRPSSQHARAVVEKVEGPTSIMFTSGSRCACSRHKLNLLRDPCCSASLKCAHENPWSFPECYAIGPSISIKGALGRLNANTAAANKRVEEMRLKEDEEGLVTGEKAVNHAVKELIDIYSCFFDRRASLLMELEVVVAKKFLAKDTKSM